MPRRPSKTPGSQATAVPGNPKISLPFTGRDIDDTDFTTVAGESSTPSSRPQPILSPPRPTSSAGGYLSSSFTRTPARSFYHQATHGSIGTYLIVSSKLPLSCHNAQTLTNSYADTPEYSSQGLRDKTQELSMHALSESGSFRSPSLLARRLDGAGSPRGRRPQDLAHDTFDSDGGRDSLDLPSAEIIQEESEPSSPEPLREVPSGRLSRPVSSAAAVNGEPHHDPRRSTDDRRGLSETSSLLPNKRSKPGRSYGATNGADVEDQRQGLRLRPAKFWHGISDAAHSATAGFHRATSPKSWDKKAIFQTAVVEPVSSLPAVFLGLLLNVLDGLSYGRCLFTCFHLQIYIAVR